MHFSSFAWFTDQPPSSLRRECAVSFAADARSRRIGRTAEAALCHRLSLALAPSLSAGVVCCCQPHERTALAFAPATACSSSSYCWSPYPGLGSTKTELKRSCTQGKSIGRDSAHVVGCGCVCVRRRAPSGRSPRPSCITFREVSVT